MLWGPTLLSSTGGSGGGGRPQLAQRRCNLVCPTTFVILFPFNFKQPGRRESYPDLPSKKLSFRSLPRPEPWQDRDANPSGPGPSSSP